ncbi:MAG TPA: helix-turn-helix domain-containing protein [Thermoanaerobaculia bacterium]|nr:helix-turn-helix domain-containing protein [Thermoanaerobaculia bacterium]
MKYLYDREHDSLTITLARRKYADSEELWPGIVVDFDEQGLPIAIDFISNASKVVDVGGLAAGRSMSVSHRDSQQVVKEIDGPTLRALREELGMTQAQLGEQLGIPSNTIARWERGELQIEKPRTLALALRALLPPEEPEAEPRARALARPGRR